MLDSLKECDLHQFSVTVMPDFFIDRIIRLGSLGDFYETAKQKETLGGGAIRGIHSKDIKGGNAVNIAYCLGKLGVKVNLFTIADKIGTAILKEVFRGLDKVTLYLLDGKQGNTTSLEFANSEGAVFNLMLNDVGDIGNFGSSRIESEKTQRVLTESDVVMVVNWGSNLKGTDLLEYSFRNSPNAFHFMDPADLRTRRNEFRDMLPKISNLIDTISVNENELDALLLSFGIDSISDVNDIVLIQDKLVNLSEMIKIELLLHTKDYALWTNGVETNLTKTFKIKPKTLTGAGDAWNAAYVVGHLLNLDKQHNLMISNAYAAAYISNSYYESPNKSEWIRFLENRTFLST
jgi:ribokinase